MKIISYIVFLSLQRVMYHPFGCMKEGDVIDIPYRFPFLKTAGGAFPFPFSSLISFLTFDTSIRYDKRTNGASSFRKYRCHVWHLKAIFVLLVYSSFVCISVELFDFFLSTAWPYFFRILFTCRPRF